MSFAAIQTGSVLYYPYLWGWEHDDHETEGRKSRPVAVGIRIPAKVEGGNDGVILFPITTKKPAAKDLSIEIPETEKRRAGLDGHKRLWIILSEYNIDLIGKSNYLNPEGPIGKFGIAFFNIVLARAFPNLVNAKIVDRREN